MTLTPSTRASLLLRLCDVQDHEAWVEFVTLYEPVVYRLLRQARIAGCRRPRRDAGAVSGRQPEHRPLGPAEERGSFRGWLRQVARNLVINWLKQSPAQRLVAAVPTCTLCWTCCPRPASRKRSSSTANCNGSCFSGPPSGCRAKSNQPPGRRFGRRASLGLSADEAAEKLGMTVGAVRVAKCRVLARLQGCGC